VGHKGEGEVGAVAAAAVDVEGCGGFVSGRGVVVAVPESEVAGIGELVGPVEQQLRISSRTYQAEPFPTDAISVVRSAISSPSSQPADNSRRKALLAIVIKEIEIDGRTVRCPFRLPRAREVQAPTGEVERSALEPLTSWVRSRRSRQPGRRPPKDLRGCPPRCPQAAQTKRVRRE
jgi:hypothetical protein